MSFLICCTVRKRSPEEKLSEQSTWPFIRTRNDNEEPPRKGNSNEKALKVRQELVQ